MLYCFIPRSLRMAAVAAAVLASALTLGTMWSRVVSAAASSSVAFTTPLSYTTGTLPFSSTVADVNFDHIPDLVTVNNMSNTVTVFIGNGDGTFAQGASYSIMCPVFAALTDLNNDGIPDMAVAGLTGGVIQVLIGNGDGTFKAPVTYHTDKASHHIAFGDFNRDGKVDIAVAKNVG